MEDSVKLPKLVPDQPITLIDVRLFEHEVVYAGGGDINALIKVHPLEIERVTRGIRLDLLQLGDQ